MQRNQEAEGNTENETPPGRHREYNFVNYLPYHLTFPVGTVSRVLSTAIHVKFGLKSAHWRIMSLLGSRGPVSTRELANFLSTEKSAISRGTSELISRGLVISVVNPIDRRLVMLHFSAKGKRLFEQMSAVALDFEEALRKSISPDEIASLDRTLGKLREAALEYQKANNLERRRGRASDAGEAETKSAARPGKTGVRRAKKSAKP